MLGKIIGTLFFFAAFFSLFTPFLENWVTFVIPGAFFWMLGICQTSLQKIEYNGELQKKLLEANSKDNKRIVYLLEKIACEKLPSKN